MNIVVLVKHALVAGFCPRIGPGGKGFEKRNLVYEMNDWDRYAVEEALRIKDQHDGEVVAISVGSDCDATLRTCIALGADRAIKVPFDSIDSYQIADLISRVIDVKDVDLVLTGFQSQDLNNALVGPMLAGILNLPYATAVTSIEVENKEVRIRRELEAGLQEGIVLCLPCLLTVQTGINQPRYPSMKSIRKASEFAIEEVMRVPAAATLEIGNMYSPPGSNGKVIEGAPDEVSAKFVDVLRERGLL